MTSRINELAGHAYAPGMEPDSWDHFFSALRAIVQTEGFALLVASFFGLVILSRVLAPRTNFRRGGSLKKSRAHAAPITRTRTRPGLLRNLRGTIVDEPQVRYRRAQDRKRTAKG